MDIKKEKTPIAVFGTGGMASRFMAGASRCADFFVAVIFNRSIDTAALFAERWGVSAATSTLSDLPSLSKVAYVATPTSSHYAVARALLSQKMNVIVEKPMCLSSRELNELLKLSFESNRLIIDGMWTLYNPSVRSLESFLGSESICAVRSFIGFSNDSGSQIRTQSAEGGAVFDILIYQAYLAFYLLGFRGDPQFSSVSLTRNVHGVVEDYRVRFRHDDTLAEFAGSIRCGGKSFFIVETTHFVVRIFHPIFNPAFVLVIPKREAALRHWLGAFLFQLGQLRFVIGRAVNSVCKGTRFFKNPLHDQVAVFAKAISDGQYKGPVTVASMRWVYSFLDTVSEISD